MSGEWQLGENGDTADRRAGPGIKDSKEADDRLADDEKSGNKRSECWNNIANQC